MEKLEKNEAPSLKRKNGIEMATPFFPKATIEKISLYFSQNWSWVAESKVRWDPLHFPVFLKEKLSTPNWSRKQRDRLPGKLFWDPLQLQQGRGVKDGRIKSKCCHVLHVAVRCW